MLLQYYLAMGGIIIKKLCYVLVMTLILCCCACVDAPEKTLDKPFESQITLSMAGKSYKGTLTRKDKNSLEMTVISEQLESPLKFNISEGGFSFSDSEREYSVPLENAPAAAAVVEIKNALDSLSLGSTTREKNIFVTSTPLGVLRYEAKNGDFLTLSTQNCDVIFDSFKRLENMLLSAK